MMNCPICGAGNKPGAASCRMCAEPLDASSAADSVLTQIHPLPSTIVIPDLNTQLGTMIFREKLPCPFCSAENEVEWSFCQQCGKKLDKLSAQPAIPEDAGLQPATASRNSADGSQVEGQGDREKSFPLPEPAVSNAGSNSAQPQRTVEPPVLDEPGYAPAEHLQGRAGDRAPVQEAQDQVCSLCGQASVKGSAYCSACGAPRPVAETIVMQSLPKPVTARLRLILDNGDSDVIYELKEETLIGRRQGDITFAHDGFMSDSHARIVRRGDDYVLIDEGSRNGIYVRIKEPWKLDQGDNILIGRQLFQFKV
jgi:hypothetical protein